MGGGIDTPGDVEVPGVDYEKLSDTRRGEPSKVIRSFRSATQGAG